LYCGKEIGADEGRYRIEVGDRVGIGHKECQDELLGKLVTVKVGRQSKLKG
jgi:hypothetical protein